MSDPNQSIQFAVPYSEDAEAAVIGAVLMNPSSYVNIAAFLKADDFYLLRHSYIWQALENLNSRNEPIDYLTVVQELRDMTWLDEIGGAAYISHLVTNTPTSVHAEVYGRLVQRASTRRQLLVAADEIKAMAMDEQKTLENVMSEAESKLFTVSEATQIRREFVPMWEAISDYYDRMEHLLQNRHESLGIPTGFRDLDQLLGGFQKSDLLVFAGRPGMGKCVAEGTLVHTDQGIVPIETLKPANIAGIPDDEGGTYYPLAIGVQTPEGVQSTSHFYDSGIRPTLRVQTRAGYTITGTHNHPLLTLAPNGEKVWKSLSELQNGDYVAIVDEKHNDPYILSQPITGQSGEQLIAEPVLTDAAFYWDEITAIEDGGLQHCYDLTVPEGHTFIANGFVNHNTSFILSVALNAARIGARVAIFTMEMGVEQMVQRLIAMETGINMQRLRLAQLTPQETARFTEAVGRLGNLPIFIDDTPALNPAQVRAKCRRLQHEHGIDMVMLDYMQLMNSGRSNDGGNRVQEMSYISRSLKELARELNVPLFSAAQLSRAVEQRPDKRPVLSDLRESGCLSGETLVYLPDEGIYTPIRDLVGKRDFRILSLNTDTYALEPDVVTKAFCTGTKPVYKLTTALGRTIRATGNHKFLTIDGWKRLDELISDDHIALPEMIEETTVASGMVLDPPLQQALYRSSKGGFETLPTGIIISDVYWDTLVSIEPDGETDVYDLTVEKNHNFVAENIIVHNSIEQDSDIVMFLYRDVVYNEATEFPNQAEVLVRKHRNGPTGVISLYFDQTITKFMDASVQRVDLSDFG